MLSRVADSLYWMSRYLERAEHMARLTVIRLTEAIEQTPGVAAADWRRVFDALYCDPPDGAETSRAFIDRFIFDRENPASLVNCVAYARDNARQVREHISGEMWEQLNRQYLRLRAARADDVWAGEPVEFFTREIDALYLFHGIAANTLSHGESWHFIQLGRYIERAGLVARLTDLYMGREAAPETEANARAHADGVSLLKMCAAFEAYCRVHTAVIRPAAVIEFLALDPDFPRSMRFSADMVASQVTAIAPKTAEGRRSKSERVAGRLTALLDYADSEEVAGERLHAFLDQVQSQAHAIHAEVYATYIDYPIEAHLAE